MSKIVRVSESFSPSMTTDNESVAGQRHIETRIKDYVANQGSLSLINEAESDFRHPQDATHY
jgi:hypothetical protein